MKSIFKPHSFWENIRLMFTDRRTQTHSPDVRAGSPENLCRRSRGLGMIRYAMTAVLAFVSISAVSPLEAKIRVVTTTSDLAYLARIVGGDRVEVTNLVPGGSDPHYMEPRPDFIVKMSKADLFAEIGMDLEIGWSPTLLAQARNPKIQRGSPGYCDASIGVRILEKPTGPVDRSRGDVHIFGNPHYWTDPLNAAIMARNLRDALVRVDSAGASVYQANYQNLFDRLKASALAQTERFKPHAGMKAAVYHREASYLAQRLRLNIVASIEEKPGVPPSAAYLKEVVQLLRRENVKIILVAPFNNRSYADAVAREIQGRVVVLPISVGSMKGAETYESTFQMSVDLLMAAVRENAGK